MTKTIMKGLPQFAHMHIWLECLMLYAGFNGREILTAYVCIYTQMKPRLSQYLALIHSTKGDVKTVPCDAQEKGGNRALLKQEACLSGSV